MKKNKMPFDYVGFEMGALLAAIFISIMWTAAGESFESQIVGWLTNSEVSYATQWRASYYRRDGTYYYIIDGQEAKRFFLPVYFLVLIPLMYFFISSLLLFVRYLTDRENIKRITIINLAIAFLFMLILKLDTNHYFLTTLT